MTGVAIIPARGGSKRIPRKNIKVFCGAPMIAHSIRAALACPGIERVVVSTDDHDIADIARQYGAETPFMRPDALSDDFTGTIPVMAHAAQWLKDHEALPGFVCCIYATAPFLSSEYLERGLAQLQGNSDADFAFSVTDYAFPIQRALKMTSNGRVEMFNPEHFSTRSQDLEEAWHDAGQFYWGRAEAWLEQRPLFSPRACPIRLPRHRVQDIDTPDDWVRAEWLFKAMQAEREHGESS